MTSPSESTELYQQLTDALFGATSNGAAVNKQMVDAAYALLAQEYSRGLDAALASLPEAWSKAGDFTSYSIDTAHKAGYNQALAEARSNIQKLKENT